MEFTSRAVGLSWLISTRLCLYDFRIEPTQTRCKGGIDIGFFTDA
ncbi:MAG: hypothetical protein ACI8Z0_002441 [Lentimonas sp.]